MAEKEGGDASGEKGKITAQKQDVSGKTEELRTHQQSQFATVQPVVQGIYQHAGSQKRQDGRFGGRCQGCISKVVPGPVGQGNDDKKQSGDVSSHKAIA